MRTRFEHAVWIGLTTVLLAACANEADGNATVAERDFRQFRTAVFPVLLRDCGFQACHGASGRFFRVWGPGRVRLDPALREFDLPSGDEVAMSYQLALSMIDRAHPQNSLLLRKPLAVEAGGVSHFGADDFGRNVYRTVNDDGYLALARWVLSASPAPAPAAPVPAAPAPVQN